MPSVEKSLTKQEMKALEIKKGQADPPGLRFDDLFLRLAFLEDNSRVIISFVDGHLEVAGCLIPVFVGH
ncbi:hypothetical protein V202x_08750 [Gimesia aquarii]|uniref:Uncharacterized protein n=1 Tax=Gimesia aquarii TaxID=2527964 RepID=A0A517WQI8_9PLAN|nr:hypothetical protein V202x_08750 [Gimesia aquarii]